MSHARTRFSRTTSFWERILVRAWYEMFSKAFVNHMLDTELTDSLWRTSVRDYLRYYCFEIIWLMSVNGDLPFWLEVNQCGQIPVLLHKWRLCFLKRIMHFRRMALSFILRARWGSVCSKVNECPAINQVRGVRVMTIGLIWRFTTKMIGYRVIITGELVWQLFDPTCSHSLFSFRFCNVRKIRMGVNGTDFRCGLVLLIKYSLYNKSQNISTRPVNARFLSFMISKRRSDQLTGWSLGMRNHLTYSILYAN